MNIDQQTNDALLRFQRNEVTESIVFIQSWREIEKDSDKKNVLARILALLLPSS